MFVIVFLVLVSNLDVRANISAVMEPRDPYVEEGGSLVLKCSLTNPGPGVDSSLISIRTKGIIYTSPHVVPLNETTSQFKLDAVNISNAGTFICMVGNKFLGPHARQYVHVFRKPEQPILTNCTLKKMEFFECSWLPSLSNQWKHVNIQKIKQELKVSVAGETINCLNDKYSGCTISLKQNNRSNILTILDQQICAQVIINVSALPSVVTHSEIKCWNLTDAIYPDPPKFVGMTQSSDGCLLQWEQPLYELYDRVRLNFYLTLVPSYNTSERIFLEVSARNITLKSCQPHTKYSGCISSMSLLGGYHSEIKEFTFQTEPTVPCKPVETSPYLMFVDQVQADILLYWKPVPEKEFCAPGFSYVLLKKVSHTDPPNSNEIKLGEDGTKWSALEDFPPSYSFIHRDVHDFCSADVCILTVAVKNDLGYKLENLTQFQIVVDSNLANSIVIDNLVSEVEMYYTFLSWNTLDKEDLISSKDVSTVIYTCKTLFHSICRNELRWKVIENNRGYYNLSENDKGLSYGVAVFVDGVSSEIFWSKKNYHLDGEVMQPSQLAVKLADVVNNTRNMHVYWSFNQDDCLNCSYVLHFTIFYCHTLDQQTCIGNISEIKAANNIRMWEVTNLESDSSFLVWMASFSRVSMSRHTVRVSSSSSRMETKNIVLFSVVIVVLVVLLVVLIFKCRKVLSCKREFIKIITPIVGRIHYCSSTDGDQAGVRISILESPRRNETETMLPRIPESPPTSSPACAVEEQFAPYTTINHIACFPSEIGDDNDDDDKILMQGTSEAFKVSCCNSNFDGSMSGLDIDQSINEIVDYPVVLNNNIHLLQQMESTDPYVPIDVMGLYSTSIEQNYDTNSFSDRL